MIFQSLLNVFKGRNPPSYFIWKYFWHLKGNFFFASIITFPSNAQNFVNINQCKNTTFLVAKSFFLHYIFIFLQFNNKLIEEVNVRGTENVIQGNNLNYLLINQRLILSRITSFTQLCLPGNQLNLPWNSHEHFYVIFFFTRNFMLISHEASRNFTWNSIHMMTV